jgi:hypothetical protein
MPKFKYLDKLWGEREQWQRWKVNDFFADEKGKVSPHRAPERQDRYEELEKLIEAANANRAADSRPQTAGTDGMKNLKAKMRENKEFFVEQSDAERARRQKELDDAVLVLRSFLTSQKMWMTRHGVIDPPNAPAVTVAYDNELKQDFTRVEFDAGGKLVSAVGRKPIDTRQMSSAFSEMGTAIYVMSQQRNLHIHSQVIGQYHHSSLLGGARVFGAGEIKVENGTIKLLTNKSGHYRPSQESLYCVLSMLQQNNSPLDFSITELAAATDERKYGSVEEFMKANYKDDDGDKRLMEAQERLRQEEEAMRNRGGGAMFFDDSE